MNNDFWGIFHDGSIVKIEKINNDTTRISIKISYLRKMFNGIDDEFLIDLTLCDKIIFKPWQDSEITDYSQISESQPEILYIKSLDPLSLDCSNGILDLNYLSAEIKLKSGRIVSYDELCEKCNEYWNKLKDCQSGI